MQVTIESLANQNDKQLKEFFSSIPYTESSIELVNDYNYEKTQLEPKHSIPNKAIAHLPRHITTVSIGGKFIVALRDISDREDPLPIHINDLTLGRYFDGFVSNLPNSVHSLSINFSNETINLDSVEKFSYIKQLIKAVESLSINIKTLDLSGTNLIRMKDDELITLFTSIPNSVKSLSFKLLNLRQLSTALSVMPEHIEEINLKDCRIGFLTGQQFDEARIKLISAIPRSVKKIGLSGNFLCKQGAIHIATLCSKLPPDLVSLDISNNDLGISVQRTITLFNKLPSDLMSLDISNNNLGQIKGDAFRTIISHLPPKLKILKFRANNFQNPIMNAKDFSLALKTIPASIYEFDLSDNDFLHFESLPRIFEQFPLTITTLRISEKNLRGMSDLELAEKLRLIPPQINTLTLSDSDLFNFSAQQFVIALSKLPKSVETLDLSNTGLSKKSGEELAVLFNGIKPHIKKLILKRNNLEHVDLNRIKQGFSALSPSIDEIDLSENGFDNLPGSQFHDRLDFIPDTVRCILDNNQFEIKNNGMLITMPPHQRLGLFKPQHAFRHQKEFASLRLIFMQMVQSGVIYTDIAYLILSFIPNISKRAPLFIKNQIETTIISSQLPKEITFLHQQECLETVRLRINALTHEITTLDLSRCGLNRIDEETLGMIFNRMPKTIKSLNLRGNGFQFNKNSRNTFIKALANIPENIIFLDLSDHGFERSDAEKLKELFINLPDTVQFVSLADEKPLSPAHQIGKRVWPNSYKTLIDGASNIMQKARNLLDDYTKEDSEFWRFICGHWNRNHIKEVSEMVKLIDNGHITNVTDLLHEFGKMEIKNESGSLGRRLGFLYKSSLELKSHSTIELKEVETKRMKLSK